MATFQCTYQWTRRFFAAGRVRLCAAIPKSCACHALYKRYHQRHVLRANTDRYAPVAQLDRAPPSEGGGHVRIVSSAPFFLCLTARYARPVVKFWLCISRPSKQAGGKSSPSADTLATDDVGQNLEQQLLPKVVALALPGGACLSEWVGRHKRTLMRWPRADAQRFSLRAHLSQRGGRCQAYGGARRIHAGRGGADGGAERPDAGTSQEGNGPRNPPGGKPMRLRSAEHRAAA
jgi:hypothetical protein